MTNPETDVSDDLIYRWARPDRELSLSFASGFQAHDFNKEDLFKKYDLNHEIRTKFIEEMETICGALRAEDFHPVFIELTYEPHQVREFLSVYYGDPGHHDAFKSVFGQNMAGDGSVDIGPVVLSEALYNSPYWLSTSSRTANRPLDRLPDEAGGLNDVVAMVYVREKKGATDDEGTISRYIKSTHERFIKAFSPARPVEEMKHLLILPFPHLAGEERHDLPVAIKPGGTIFTLGAFGQSYDACTLERKLSELSWALVLQLSKAGYEEWNRAERERHTLNEVASLRGNVYHEVASSCRDSARLLAQAQSFLEAAGRSSETERLSDLILNAHGIIDDLGRSALALTTDLEPLDRSQKEPMLRWAAHKAVARLSRALRHGSPPREIEWHGLSAEDVVVRLDAIEGTLRTEPMVSSRTEDQQLEALSVALKNLITNAVLHDGEHCHSNPLAKLSARKPTTSMGFIDSSLLIQNEGTLEDDVAKNSFDSKNGVCTGIGWHKAGTRMLVNRGTQAAQSILTALGYSVAISSHVGTVTVQISWTK